MLREDRGIQVQLLFREANQLADYIANTIIDSEEKHIFR